MTYDYDILFLGGGLNYAGAVVASKRGLKTALVEKNPSHLGGTCLHNGCIPSKMYLGAAETVRASKNPHFEGSISLKMERLDDEKEKLLLSATQAIMRQCEKVDIMEGEGFLTAPHTVRVKERKITARHVVIGTGSSPFIPDGIEYDGKGVVTSDEILNIRTLPEKIAIYGDGAIGLETASFFASSGVPTELIWRHDTLLRKAHPAISKNLFRQMQELGVTLLRNRSIKSAKTTGRGVHILYEDGSDHYVPMLLVATGRRANVSAVECDEIQTDSRGIVTDDHFETTLPNHYAIGDCNGKLQLAHAARAEVLYVVAKIVGDEPETLNLENVVKFIHTLPCGYASVGKSKSDLEKSGVCYKESTVFLRGLPFPHTHDGDLGVMALYADDEGFILGGEIFSPDAEELIAVVSMALAGEMDARLARRTVLAHPTFSESLERAFRRL
ncbi:dihydrolipoyl dehydrogenase family protein [Hydrogenimonas urashimensis]|uniref:dihydrolipoyl dehydrogenase family protein n=1 Tax=Hydrogenimonas urashimensis TaxID=2740515 RepID=UPI001915E428|nr:NAD(P)/FAD-dependent oxidoreductase [Hydrogenimonas urashimensis]